MGGNGEELGGMGRNGEGIWSRTLTFILLAHPFSHTMNALSQTIHIQNCPLASFICLISFIVLSDVSELLPKASKNFCNPSPSLTFTLNSVSSLTSFGMSLDSLTEIP